MDIDRSGQLFIRLIANIGPNALTAVELVLHRTLSRGVANEHGEQVDAKPFGSVQPLLERHQLAQPGRLADLAPKRHEWARAPRGGDVRVLGETLHRLLDHDGK